MKGNVAGERLGEEEFDSHLTWSDLGGACDVRRGRRYGRDRGQAHGNDCGGERGREAVPEVPAPTGAAAGTVTVSSNAPSATGCPFTDSTLK